MPTTAQRRVIDPILSNVVQGYVHPEHVGHHLFPRVPVYVAGGKIIEFGKDSFRLYSTSRAPGTAYKRRQFGYEGKDYALANHGIEVPVPREHMRDAAQVPGIDLASRAIMANMSTTSLVLEKEQADLARTAANYDANHKVTLTSTDQWDDAASTPIADIEAAKEAIRSTCGVYPNTMLLGAKVFKSLKEHADIVDKIKYSQKGVITVDLLASIFDIENVQVGKAIAFDDDDSTIDVWGKDVVLAYVPRTISGREEPSYGYTYTMEGHPLVETPYWEEQTKSWVYGVGFERKPVLSGITSGYLIVDAVSA